MIDQAAEALGIALPQVKTALVGHKSHIKAFVDKGFERIETSDVINNTIGKIQETLLFVALGISLQDYVRFRTIAGTLDYSFSHKVTFYGGKNHIQKDDAEFVLIFSIETIVEIESRAGDLDKPFGSKYWF